MKVILKQDVPKLGQRGEIKDVASGYARNHLIPRGLAEEATSSRIREWKHYKDKVEKNLKQQEEQAVEMTRKLAQCDLVFNLPAGEGGRLFGSVTSADIAAKLEEAGYPVDKKKIEMTEPIKSLGTHIVVIRLQPGIKAEVPVKVEKENQD